MAIASQATGSSRLDRQSTAQVTARRKADSGTAVVVRLCLLTHFGTCALALLCLGGCGGRVDSDELSSVAPDASTTDVVPSDAGVVDGSLPDDDGPSVAVEPGCPDAAPKPPNYQCDPFAAPPGDCPSGKACQPHVIEGEDSCDPGQAVAECLPAGAGEAGAPCAALAHCAAGYLCVYDQQFTCQKLCKPNETAYCGGGEICEGIADLPGVGTCN